MTRPHCPSISPSGLRCKRHAPHPDRQHGNGLVEWTNDDPPDTRATERADLLAWLDYDMDLDPYTVMRVREAVRAGEHVGVASDSRATNAAPRV